MKKIYFLLFAFALLSGYAGYSQANDPCSGAITISCGQTISGTTAAATPDAVGTCNFVNLTTGPGLWYTFAGDGSTTTLSLCGSSFDTEIGVFSGSCGSLTCVTANDDFCGLQSQVTFTAAIGTTYYVLVTGFSTASGNFTLTRTCSFPPANDLCSGAININCGQTIAGNTSGATVDAVSSCITTLNTAPGVWYTMVGDGSITTLSLCGSSYDTKIGVFSGSCASLTCVTGNDDFCGFQSQVSFTANVGTTYYILVTGFSTASGAFTLTRTCSFPLPNDLCTGAITINCGQTINGNTSTATVDAVPTCGTTLNTAPGVWYTFVGDGSNVTLSLCGSSYDTKIGVFSGSCASLTCVTGNDDFCGLQSQVTFTSVLGTNYYVLVTGFSSAAGAFTLNRSCIFPCTGVPSPGSISGPGSVICGPASVTLTLSGYPVVSGLSFQWKSSSVPGGPYVAIPGATNPTYTFTASATAYYIVTVTCTNSGGAANTVEFPLRVSNLAHSNIVATPNTSCSPGSTLITGTVSGSAVAGNYTHTMTGPGTIVQNPPSGVNNSNFSFSVTNIPSGTQTYTITSTDPAGCTKVSTVTVTVNPTPVVTIVPAAPVICAGAIQRIDAQSLPLIAQTYTNSTNIQLPPSPATVGNGDPYPSTISVSGMLTSGVSVKSVTLGTIFHTFPDDIDVVLVSPTGQSVILMSDAGGGSGLVGQTYTLDDAAAAALADASFNPTGTYKPTNYGAGDNWPAPGPGGAPSSTTLSSFTGNMNGVWSLYAVDDASGDRGVISTWSITFNTPAPVVFSPTTNLFTDAGATIPYTGTPTYTVWSQPPTTITYTASTTSAAGCTGSSTVTVTVNQLPAITVQPVALAAPVCPGFNVNYSVTATGAGLTYQWQVSTDNGVTWNNLVNAVNAYAGVTTSTMTVLNVQTAQNNYRYRVIVSGTCAPSVTSNSVTLVVSTPPTITSLTTNPATPTICVNGNITFTVVAAGTPAPNIYQWQVSTDGGVTWTNLTTGGSYTSIFTITGATAAMNNNRYRVIVTNSCGQSVTSASVTLIVNALPTVTATALTNRICLTDTLVPLSGTPVGGSWSGLGVSGTYFVPSATAVGVYTLTYTYSNAANCSASATITAKVEDCAERIRLLRNDAVILYPNPNNGSFNIRINSTLYNYLGMRVYNTSGQLVRVQSFNGLVYGRVVPIDLRNLPGGTYLVKFYYDDGIRTSEKGFNVVIQR